MTQPNYTHIAVVLDRSGSMDSIRSDTIGGFNRYLEDQKRLPGRATLTLVQFDHEYLVPYSFVPIQAVPALTGKTYIPRGNTALLNAIGRTIKDTGQRLSELSEGERPSKVLCVIITDGRENASQDEPDSRLRYTKPQINEMITHQRQAYQWEFVFLAANQDAIQEGAAYGIAAHSSMTYAANAAGTANAFDSASINTSNLRSMGVPFAFSQEDRQKQEDAGA